MNTQLLIENITNPALLFFILGVLAVYLKSDLAVPESTAKFISLYLLLSIGFRGGQELLHETFTHETIIVILAGIFLAAAIPFYSFFLLKKKLGVYNAGAIAAAYGSVSAVTFVTAISFLESKQIVFNGHMVAVMALMESPSIIVGLLLISVYNNKKSTYRKRELVKHSFTNASVFLIMGSMLIGFITSEKQAEGIRPFTNDLFKGFLAIFLLDMGISSGKKMKSFFNNGWFPLLFAFFIPLFNGIICAYFSQFFISSSSDRFILSVLAASASYIAVPAAMKTTVPEANSGLFIPMALAITFPVNIIIGLPLYFAIVNL